MPWHEDADSVVAAISAFLARDGSAAREAPPDEALHLRREGEVWRLRFMGRQALLRDSWRIWRACSIARARQSTYWI